MLWCKALSQKMHMHKTKNCQHPAINFVLVLSTKKFSVRDNEICFQNTLSVVVSLRGLYIKLINCKGNTHTSTMVPLLI